LRQHARSITRAEKSVTKRELFGANARDGFMLAMPINWSFVFLGLVVASIVLCVLTSLILKELNKHH
jgi:hypothetical protein